MTLHLLKLCVGAESIADLRAWTRLRRKRAPDAQAGTVHAHVTRMVPKRATELLDGGSLYWVIKGQTCARQKLIGIEPFVDSAGVKRCALQLDDEVDRLAPAAASCLPGLALSRTRRSPARPRGLRRRAGRYARSPAAGAVGTGSDLTVQALADFIVSAMSA